MASLHALGRRAASQARLSADAARIPDAPAALRLSSRLTVEAERPSAQASDRIECPAAMPLEISARSASVSASLERFLARGRIPPDGLQ